MIKGKIDIDVAAIALIILILLAFWNGVIDFFIAFLLIFLCAGGEIVIGESENGEDNEK